MVENSLNTIYDQSLTDKRDFYDVVVHPDKLRTFFRQHGVKNSDIDATQFFFSHKPLRWMGEPVLGRYDPSRNKLSISTNHYWKSYHNHRILAEQIATGDKKPHSRQFKDILTTERLSGYLANPSIPLERKISFADRLIVQGINSKLNTTFVHEAKHLIDDKTAPMYSRIHEGLALSALVGGIYAGWLTGSFIPPTEIPFLDSAKNVPIMALTTYTCLQLASLLSPLEARANKFEKELARKKEWDNIITFHPHLDWRSISRWQY